MKRRITEDYYISRQALENYFKEQGHDVLFARDVIQAIKFLTSYDLWLDILDRNILGVDKSGRSQKIHHENPKEDTK